MSFFHATPVVQPGNLPAPGVVQPPLQAGFILDGPFKLIAESEPLFGDLTAALPDSGAFAQVMVRNLRWLLDHPELKGIFDSLVIEAITEHIRRSEFQDRPARVTCRFGSPSQQRAEAFVHQYRLGVAHVIYEVEAVGDMWFADMDAINAGFDYFTMPLPASLAQQFDRARNYLAGMTKNIGQLPAMTDPEVLAPGGAKVIAVAGVVA
jgi:hypothetical protein